MKMDILIFLYLGLIVFKSSVHCQLLTYNIAHMAQLKSSSVLSYGSYNYDTTNVVDGNPGTSPDACNCCWSSADETDPLLEVTLPRHEYLVNIVLQGRTDDPDEPRKLFGLNVEADGITVPDKWIFVNSTQNSVSIDLQTRPVKSIIIKRPKMHDSSREWFLIVCEVYINIQVVELFQQLRNTSKTNQTGLFSNNPDYGSSKAIDGLNNYNLDACKCCSVTADANPPISWWHIDLKKKYTAYGLEIFGREKRNEDDNKQIQNAQIYASNSSMEDSIDTGYLLFVVPTIHDTTHFIKHLQRPVIAQYFIVRINNTQLTLCEIIVYGKGYCNVGSFGLSCTSKCHCEDKMSCHPWTGYCQTPRCMPGWEGPSCDKECTAGKFGRDCNRTCSSNCLHGFDQCSKIYGECQSGCVAGFKGHNCSTPCETGRFGLNCVSYCSIHCFEGIGQCNKSSGICNEGCEAGYMGNNCSTVCPSGQYAQNCNRTCSDHCMNGKAACNESTGYCMDGCNPGFTGPKCFQDCPRGTFGVNCSGKCHCQNETNCRQTDGYCSTGCAFGWSGFNCSKDINILSRVDVQTAMSSTLLNWTSNRAIDGKIGPIPEDCNCCSGTKNSQLSWWTVDLGQRYPISSVTVYSRENEEKYKQLTDFKLYFSNKTEQSSYHLVENTTKRIDGNEHVLTFSNQLTRYIKIERPGVLTLCEVLVTEGECEVGTFGEECSQICHCADERACDKRNGYCQSDACKVGWIGTSCNKKCPKNTFGDKCSESCFCADGTCTNDYGICENGCQDGYTGFHCNQVGETHQGEQKKNSTALVAGVVSGSIIVMILSALIVVVLIFRKRKSENNKSHYSTPKSQAAQDDTDYDTLDVLNDNQGQRSTAYENEVVSSM